MRFHRCPPPPLRRCTVGCTTLPSISAASTNGRGSSWGPAGDDMEMLFHKGIFASLCSCDHFSPGERPPEAPDAGDCNPDRPSRWPTRHGWGAPSPATGAISPISAQNLGALHLSPHAQVPPASALRRVRLSLQLVTKRSRHIRDHLPSRSFA
jgi:hypothetical protein